MNSVPTFYTPAVPETNGYSNVDLNALGSTYATDFSHNETALMQRIVRSMIYDAAPQQFMDLAILNMNATQTVDSDEFFYHEMGYGRDPIVTPDPLAVTVTTGATQTIPVTDASFDLVSLDSILSYGDTNDQATVTAKDGAASPKTITVTKMTGAADLPALASGSQYTFSYHSPVEMDGADYINTYFRISTIERLNFVQQLVCALRMGRLELHKYQKAGSTSNYIAMQQQKMLMQFRTSISNIIWNGKLGEVTLANGGVAKTAAGINNIMVDAGSPIYDTTLANIGPQLEELCLDTEFQTWGYRRFLYATPRVIHYLSQHYKRDLTRYEPNDQAAKLGLKEMDMGSTKLVFVPVKRFEERSCFPAFFSRRVFVLDQSSIFPVRIFPEEMGVTLPRQNMGTLNNYQDTWISATVSLIFHNPLGCGALNITDLNV